MLCQHHHHDISSSLNCSTIVVVVVIVKIVMGVVVVVLVGFAVVYLLFGCGSRNTFSRLSFFLQPKKRKASANYVDNMNTVNYVLVGII